MAKSIGQRAKTYKNGVVVRVVGPRVYTKDVKAGKVTKPAGVVIKDANDIEYGKNNKAAHPFIRPSLPQTESQTKKVIAAGYKTSVEKIATGGKI